MKIYTTAFLVALLAFTADYVFDGKAVVRLIRSLPGSRPNPDTFRDIFELLESRGFKHESHFVTSEDGYITQMVRVVNPFVKDRSKLKPVILLHGFSCTGAVFLTGANGSLDENGHYYEYDENGSQIRDPNNVGVNLGFVLASREFDVWLPNYRGNSYSTNHTELDTNSMKYWSFSIDEMTDYDLPVFIDYVRTVTNRSSVGFVGYSQANMMMLGLLSKRTEYADRVKPFISLSPVFYMHKPLTPIRFIAPLQYMLRLVPTYFPRVGYVRAIYSAICENLFLQPLCYFFYHQTMGSHQKNIHLDRIGVYLSNVPRDTSTITAAHIFQLIQNGLPYYMDYGKSQNLIKYKSEMPPLYNASKITSKHMAFVYAKKDWFNHMDCIVSLKKDLKVELLEDYCLEDPELNHMDFVWGKNIGLNLNKRVIELLSLY